MSGTQRLIYEREEEKVVVPKNLKPSTQAISIFKSKPFSTKREVKELDVQQKKRKETDMARGNNGVFGYTFDGKNFKLTSEKRNAYLNEGVHLDRPLETALCQFLRPAFYGTKAQCPK